MSDLNNAAAAAVNSAVSENIPPKPQTKPERPYFSSGPCVKRPGWSLNALDDAFISRSHRAKGGKDKLKLAIDLTKEILNIPADYKVGIVPASDTGAVEMALWNLLGERGVDMLSFESFGSDWVTDVKNQLKLEDLRLFEADYGQLPDLSQVDFDRDVVFTFNGTTSGVRVPKHKWIKSDRKGLTIADATSAVFAQEMPWEDLDVVTYSWQKALGGEAAHGMLILSPRAVARLESYKPQWPLPKIFRLTKKGKLNEGIFVGETINTPSMLAVEDYLDALNWVKSLGGVEAMIKRADDNLNLVADYVSQVNYLDFLCKDEAVRSNTSVCLVFADADIANLSDDDKSAFAKKVVKLLDSEDAAYDIGAYRSAPSGLRIWCGGTVESADLKAFFPWLEWAFYTAKAEFVK